MSVLFGVFQTGKAEIEVSRKHLGMSRCHNSKIKGNTKWDDLDIAEKIDLALRIFNKLFFDLDLPSLPESAKDCIRDYMKRFGLEDPQVIWNDVAI